jgi:hypothetical protein
VCNSSFDSNCSELLKFTTERRQIDVLRDVLYGQIVYRSYSLTPFVLEDDIKASIEYGFARTKSEEDVIDEPLAIMAVRNRLGEKGRFSLLDRLRPDVGSSPRGKMCLKPTLPSMCTKFLRIAQD